MALFDALIRRRTNPYSTHPHHCVTSLRGLLLRKVCFLQLMTHELMRPMLFQLVNRRTKGGRAFKQQLMTLTGTEKFSPERALCLMTQLGLSQNRYHVLHMLCPEVLPAWGQVKQIRSEKAAPLTPLFLRPSDAQTAVVTAAAETTTAAEAQLPQQPPFDVVGGTSAGGEELNLASRSESDSDTDDDADEALMVQLDAVMALLPSVVDDAAEPPAVAAAAAAAAAAASPPAPGSALVGFGISDIAKVLQEEVESYVRSLPADKVAALTEIHVKVGGDNFSFQNHQGTGSRFIEQFSLCVIRPGQSNNAVGGAGGTGRILVLLEGKESEPLVRVAWSHISPQLPQRVFVDGISFEIKWHLSADYKLACTLFGHQGQSAANPCLWCLTTKNQLLGSSMVSQVAIANRDPEMMVTIGKLAEKHLFWNTDRKGYHLKGVKELRADEELRTLMATSCRQCGAVSAEPDGSDAPSCHPEAGFCFPANTRLLKTADFDAWRASIVRAPMSNIISVGRYAPELLHNVLNAVNNTLDFCVSMGMQIKVNLLDFFSSDLKKPRPITK